MTDAVATPAAKPKITASPSWADTSVRWLRMDGAKRGIRHTPNHSSLAYSKLLYDALVRMKYHYFEMVDERKFSDKSWKNSLENLAAEWTKVDHGKMTKFIVDGGYSKLIEKKVMAKAADGREVRESMKVSTPDGDIELNLEDVEEEIVKGSVLPRSQVSPKHELEEILEDESRKTDPRYGVW